MDKWIIDPWQKNNGWMTEVYMIIDEWMSNERLIEESAKKTEWENQREKK